jgi:hypothetical protein
MKLVGSSRKSSLCAFSKLTSVGMLAKLTSVGMLGMLAKDIRNLVDHLSRMIAVVGQSDRLPSAEIASLRTLALNTDCTIVAVKEQLARIISALSPAQLGREKKVDTIFTVSNGEIGYGFEDAVWQILATWDTWTSRAAMSTVVSAWPLKTRERVRILRSAILRAHWLAAERTRYAAMELAVTLDLAYSVFVRHADVDGELVVGIKFYKNANVDDYQTALRDYERWVDNCFDSLRRFAKATNYFLAAYRSEVNSSFASATHKLLLEEDGSPALFEWDADERMVLTSAQENNWSTFKETIHYEHTIVLP